MIILEIIIGGIILTYSVFRLNKFIQQSNDKHTNCYEIRFYHDLAHVKRLLTIPMTTTTITTTLEQEEQNLLQLCKNPIFYNTMLEAGVHFIEIYDTDLGRSWFECYVKQP
jgi:hypothetical protein